MSQPKAMITGVGRSGTRYLYRVLNELGLNVGHEHYWTTGTPQEGLDVDISWQGAWEHYTGPVYFQARDPLLTIRSLYHVPPEGGHREKRVRWGRANEDHGIRCKLKRIPGQEANDCEGCLGEALRWWHLWSRQSLARATRWWGVERVTPQDLRPVVALSGRQVSDEQIQARLNRISKKDNKKARRGRHPMVLWSDLMHLPEYLAAREQARELGYEMQAKTCESARVV